MEKPLGKIPWCSPLQFVCVTTISPSSMREDFFSPPVCIRCEVHQQWGFPEEISARQTFFLEMMEQHPHHIICFEIVNWCSYWVCQTVQIGELTIKFAKLVNCRFDCQTVQLFEFPSIFVHPPFGNTTLEWFMPSSQRMKVWLIDS